MKWWMWLMLGAITFVIIVFVGSVAAGFIYGSHETERIRIQAEKTLKEIQEATNSAK